MSDIEDLDGVDTEVPMVPIVEVPGGQGSERRRRRRRQSVDMSPVDTEEEEGQEGSEEEAWVSETGSLSARERRRQRRGSQSKGKNGRTGIDMTPPDKLLRLAEKKAQKYLQQKKVDQCIHERIRCTALAQIVHGQKHWRVARSYANLAETYLDQKAYTAQAQYHCETAKTIMLGGVHTSASEQEKASIYSVLVKIFYTLGRALTAMKKYAEAEQSLSKADKIAREKSKLSWVTSEDCDEVDIDLSLALARLSAKQNKYVVAQAQFEKALEILQDRYGNDNLELIAVYHELGKLEQMKGRHANHDQAVDMFLQAHSVAASQYKEGSLELVDTALALARAYANTGREEAESSAESYLNECVSVCVTQFGPQHTKTLEVQDELASLYIRTERHQDALSLLKSSLDQKMETYGDYSEPVSDAYKLIGSIHLSQGSIEKALRMYKKCHGVQCLVLGVNHRKSQDTQRTMDILMASPSISRKFVLSKQDELEKRPRFNAVVSRGNPVGGPK